MLSANTGMARNADQAASLMDCHLRPMNHTALIARRDMVVAPLLAALPLALSAATAEAGHVDPA